MQKVLKTGAWKSIDKDSTHVYIKSKINKIGILTGRLLDNLSICLLVDIMALLISICISLERLQICIGILLAPRLAQEQKMIGNFELAYAAIPSGTIAVLVQSLFYGQNRPLTQTLIKIS